MPHCTILGDSLATGVACYRPECRADTKVGITSGRYAAAHLMAVTAEIALISLGVNDGSSSMTTTENLIHLRTGFQSRRVYWILPARSDATRALIAGVGTPSATN